ncbi:MAG: 16S rRNA processing protein RimM [Firmicutes bacterium]|nr:16S rRNA processing protein RimM [Bacillota bacterium]
MDRIKVGKIVSAVGIKGEVKVYPYTDYPERFEELDEVYAGDDGKVLYIDKVRYHKNMAIIKFEDIDDRNTAEFWKDTFLCIDKKDLRALDEDEYFIFDLIGLKAVDDCDNYIGKVTDVIQNTAQDIYEITADNGNTILIPAVYEFITDIDINSGIMRIKPIEGLLGEQEEV